MLIFKCIWGAVLGAIQGFVASFFVGMGLWAVVGLVAWDGKTGMAAAGFAVLLVPFQMVMGLIEPIQEERKRRQEAEQRRRRKDIARQEHYRQEQQRLHDKMRRLGERSLTLFESMQHHLRSADESLNQAEVEFAEGAFAPFWDCIESAAEELGRFNEGAQHIEDSSSRYGELIKKYQATPPPFPLEYQSITKLRVATASARHMQNLVRQAQRDFQFAVIYEQRKTNQLLVAGFTNLAQALKDMTWQLESSIDDLAQSVHGMASTFDSRLGAMTDTASRAASQAALREEQVLTMLDNIQRGRRPSP